MIRVNHARRSRKHDGRQNIPRSDELFKLQRKLFIENFEANFEKCYHQYSKRYVIGKKSDKYLS
jgi:hypothetical protein